ncbi:site-2 protease family protein [Candidatus Woesearchaeota archaeon]|nr:site-2 protease family protein [Candidatus Woesearchaeota archaeon]
MSFLAQYGSVIAFYLIIIFLIVRYRKRFDFQGKIIAMLRTKIGLKLMHKWGTNGRRFVKGLATAGIYAGFLGMAATIYMIIDGLWKLLFVPSAPPTFAPVLPGVNIPGVEIFVPFWYGIIALFLTIVVHEFSHGVVAAAHKMKVKNSGFVMFGPLPGAFVEPDEKQLRKAKPKAQLSVYAAGPFSNILLTIILILLFGFLPLFVSGMGGTPSEGLQTFTRYTSVVNFGELRDDMYQATGLRILEVKNGSGADEAGLANDTVIRSIDGVDVRDNLSAFADEIVSFQNLTPGDEVVFSNENETWTITTQQHPDNESRGWIGIVFDTGFVTEKNPKAVEKYGATGFKGLEILYQQVLWLIILSSGIGLANLLPLGPVDGGRMLLVALERYLPKKKAQMVWGKISMVVFLLVIILLIGPILQNLLG